MKNKKFLFLVLAIFTTLTFSVAAAEDIDEERYAAIKEIDFFTYQISNKANEFIEVMEEVYDFFCEEEEYKKAGELQDLIDDFIEEMRMALNEIFSYNIEILLARTKEQIQDFKYEALGDDPDQDLEDLKNDIDAQIQEFKELMNMYKSLLN